MISIVIPTKNEEHYLPKLLLSIRNQNYKDYEIIVADGNSADRTRRIARKFGCRVIIDKKRGSPAIERNNGAKIARGEMLLFLDADVRLPQGFLKKLIQEIRKKKLDVGSCFFEPYDGKNIDRLIVEITNSLMDL